MGSAPEHSTDTPGSGDQPDEDLGVDVVAKSTAQEAEQSDDKPAEGDKAGR
ncbi:MAG: hypothetical protein NVSMB32_09720 [Actinomycetota bacterium]